MQFKGSKVTIPHREAKYNLKSAEAKLLKMGATCNVKSAKAIVSASHMQFDNSRRGIFQGSVNDTYNGKSIEKQYNESPRYKSYAM